MKITYKCFKRGKVEWKNKHVQIHCTKVQLPNRKYKFSNHISDDKNATQVTIYMPYTSIIKQLKCVPILEA
jgi:hypothetical protein